MLILSVSQYAIAVYAPNKSFEHRTWKSIAFRCCTPAIIYVFSLLLASVRVAVLACASARSVFLYFLTAALKDCTVIHQARCAVPNYREMRSKLASAYNNFKLYYWYGDQTNVANVVSIPCSVRQRQVFLLLYRFLYSQSVRSFKRHWLLCLLPVLSRFLVPLKLLLFPIPRTSWYNFSLRTLLLMFLARTVT